MTERLHLFPYRTQKLSSPVLMVLGPQGPGRVSRRRVKEKETTEMLFLFLFDPLMQSFALLIDILGLKLLKEFISRRLKLHKQVMETLLV
jgi:hypothetical protein